MANPVVLMRTPAETALIERFAAEKAALPGAAAERAAAFARFEAAGLPTRRIENYHYTDLRAHLRAIPADAPAATGGPSLAVEGFDRLAFVNGRWTGGSSPEGVRVEPIADAWRAGSVRPGAAMGRASDVVVDLNTALAREGVRIAVEPGASARLHLAFAEILDAPGLILPRVAIELGEGASLSLFESHEGPDGVAYPVNSVVEAVLADGASLEHVRLNASGKAATVLSTLAATLGEGAELATTGLTLGGALSRHQVFVTYAGENAKASIRGAALLNGRQHHDTTLVVDHAVPHGESRELFRTVLDGEAQGVFQGKIIVRPHAQKTDGQMASNALLLSDEAGMANKPELEIFADDVVCAHGATCGALDENQLFYLMARGLPKREAEALLVEAFVGEVFDALRDEGLRDDLAARVAGWMAERAAS